MALWGPSLKARYEIALIYYADPPSRSVDAPRLLLFQSLFVVMYQLVLLASVYGISAHLHTPSNHEGSPRHVSLLHPIYFHMYFKSRTGCTGFR